MLYMKHNQVRYKAVWTKTLENVNPRMMDVAVIDTLDNATISYFRADTLTEAHSAMKSARNVAKDLNKQGWTKFGH